MERREWVFVRINEKLLRRIRRQESGRTRKAITRHKGIEAVHRGFSGSRRLRPLTARPIFQVVLRFSRYTFIS